MRSIGMDYVDLPEQFRGKQGQGLRIRFDHDDMKAICRNLTPNQARGEGKVTPTKLYRLVMEEDPDAIEQCLWLGLSHDDKKIDLVDVGRLMRRAMEDGLEYADARRAILRTFVACGFSSAEVYTKALEDAESREGKGSTSPTSPTRTSTTSPTTADSASSMSTPG
jgi:hypothetical protein